MPDLNLSLAVGEYDHVRDLTTGAVRASGISITTVHGPIEDILIRGHWHDEWDVVETGLGAYVMRLARGEQPVVAIPVFTSRVFRHSAIYVRSDAGIDLPKDLAGKRIGVPEWGQAAAVYARDKLGAGDRLDGPAIVEQFDSTTVILAGQRAAVDPYGNIVITTGA